MEKSIKDRKGFATGLAFLVFAAFTAINAYSYNLGSSSAPEPGYFPFFASVLLACTGITLIFVSMLRNTPVIELPSFNLPVLIAIIASICAFAATVGTLGLIVAVPVQIALASLAHSKSTLRTTLVSILVTSLLTWLVFVQLLKLQIPVLPNFITG